MSLISSSTGLTRYRVVEDVPDELFRQVPELLKRHAFQDIDNTADERSFGWTNFDDMLDTEWVESIPDKGQFIVFSLRLETRRIPPATLKKHFNIALKRELIQAKEQGKNFLSRDRKKEIKEQVTLKLRARFLPIPAVFDAAWDVRTNRVYFDSGNAKSRELFEDCFKLTFDLSLEPLTPFFLARDMLGEDMVAKLEGLEPTIFV